MDVTICSVMKGLGEVAIAESTVVVIDVLRASTTIICLMERGADEVRVVGDYEAAYHLKQQGYVLVGERSDEQLPGSDLDNSPSGVLRTDWRKARVVVATTNGTRALAAVQHGYKVVIGALRNIDAASLYVRRVRRPVVLVPIGHLGEPRLEDELCAAAFRRRIVGEAVDWSALREAVLAERESRMQARGEGYRQDVLVSTIANASDAVPVLSCDLTLRRA